MKKVVIYSSTVCPYCVKAKKLLETKGVDYKELNIDENPDFIDESVKRSGGRTTVPQVFIDDVHVGGCDELYDLDRENKLDPLLES